MANIRELRAVFTAQADGLRRTMGGIQTEMRNVSSSAETAAKNVQKNWEAAGAKMTDIGKKASTYLTVPIVAAGTAGVKFAMDQEKSFSKVSTLLDSSSVDYDKYKKDIRAASSEMGVSFDDYSESVYGAISAGIDQADAIEFVATAAKLAKGGFTDNATAVDVMTTAINAYGLEASDAGRVSDLLINTQNLGKTTVDELASSLGGVIPIANAQNVSLEQLSTGYAVLTKNGIATSEAGTYMKSMFGELGKSGSKTDKILREKLGKSFAELTAEGMNTGEILNILQDEATNSGLSLADLFGSAEAGTAAMTLIKDGGDDFNATLDSMNNVSGETTEAFNKMENAAGVKMAKAFNSLKNSAASFGDMVLPVVATLAEYLAKVAGKIQELGPSAKWLIMIFGLILAAIGPVLLALGSVASALAPLAAAVTKAGGVLKFLRLGMMALTGPIGLTVAAIIALGAGFIAAYKNSETFRNAIKTAGNMVKEFVGKVKTAFEGIKQLFSGNTAQGASLLLAVGLDNDTIVKIIKAVRTIKDTFTDLVSKVKAAIKSIKAIFSGNSAEAASLLKAVGLTDEQIVKFIKIFATIRDTAKKVFGEVVSFLKDSFNKIKDFFKNDGAQILEAGKNIFNGLVVAGKALGVGLGAAFQGILKVIKFVMPLVLSIIKSVWGNIKGVITGALDVIMGAVKIFSGLFTGDFKKMFEGLKQVFSGAIKVIWNGIQLTFFGKILGGAKLFVSSFSGFFVSLWRTVIQLFKGQTKQAGITISTAWASILRTTKDIFGKVFNYFKDIFKNILAAKRVFIDGGKRLFSTGLSAIRTTVVNIFTKIFNFYKSIFSKMSSAKRSFIDGAKRIFSNGVSAIRTNTSNGFNKMLEFFRSIFSKMGNAKRSFVDGAKRIFSNAWNSVWTTTRNIFGKVYDYFKSIFSKIYNTVTSSSTNIFRKLRDTWSSLKTNTSNSFRDIYNGIRDRFKNIVDLAKGLPKRIGDGIGSMASKVTTGVTKVINSLAKTLGKGINGTIKGVNWVLDKIGVSAKSAIPLWTVPAYAQGTDHKRGPKGAHPGGLAMVNDGKGSNSGPEMIQTPDGQSFMAKGKNVLMNLAKGAKVWSATETRKILDMVPHYNTGDLKGKIRAAGDFVSEKYNAGKEKVKEIGGKVKDVALNVFDYVKNPSGLFDLALKTLGIEKPDNDGMIGKMAVGAWNKTKKAAVDYVKGKLGDFGATQSGITITGGNGGGFGAPFRFTSGPGPRNTGIPGASTMHKGWDWAAPVGTPIPSVTDGVGHRTGFHRLSGNFVEVKDNTGKVHRYQHNSKNIVKVGQPVKKGQTIALVGATGVGSGPHLHYETRAYADGGIADEAQLAWIAEGGWAESIISHDPAKRVSQKAIWQKTGEELGFGQVGSAENGQFLELLQRIAEGVESGHDIIMKERVVASILEPHISERQRLHRKVKEEF